MGTYTIDLRSRLVPRSLEIWRLFPGKDYKFLQEIREQRAVFLDFPGLPLPAGAIDDGLPDLSERIMVSHAVADWSRKRQLANPDEKDATPAPSFVPSDYTSSRKPSNLAAAKGAVSGLFGRAKKGDLIIVPTPIASRGILVGELLHGPDVRTAVKSKRYPDIEIPAREVSWFPTINELELPERVSEVMRRPNPFVSFDRRLYPEVFDRTFGTYVYENSYAAKFDTKGSRFTGEDNLDFIILAEAVAKMVQEYESGGSISSYGDLLHLATAEKSAEYRFDLSININSPGSILSKSASLSVLVFTALFALMQSSAADDGVPTAHVVNSASTVEDDHCTPHIDARVRESLEFMQFAVWKEACERSERLREKPVMQGVATARPDAAQPPFKP